jgi:hypothetical protein
MPAAALVAFISIPFLYFSPIIAHLLQEQAPCSVSEGALRRITEVKTMTRRRKNRRNAGYRLHNITKNSTHNSITTITTTIISKNKNTKLSTTDATELQAFF